MMKALYEKPALDIVEFENEDIVTDSNETEMDWLD